MTDKYACQENVRKMTIYDNIFPLGMGTNRFIVTGPSDRPGIERAANLVAKALDAGVSYIDVAHTYSKGTALEVCRLAFQLTPTRPNVTIKSTYQTDQSRDGALRRVDQTFHSLGIDHASYFVCWNISDWNQFLAITQKGGIYEGALEAKKQGLVDHICFSTHASPEEIVRMLKTGLFEGVTISLSALNSKIMTPVLDCAQACNVGVVVMNPLAGGLIPQHNSYFSFLRHPSDSSTVEAALRFVYAHPAVKIVLSGMSTMKEMQENIAAFIGKQPEADNERINRVRTHLAGMDGFCTGCSYCDGCPKGIPIYKLMQAYNMRLFPSGKNRGNDPELNVDSSVCGSLKNNFYFIPESAQNPCIGCGACESRCTAHLPIIKRINSMYEMFDRRCFSQQGMKKRLRKLIGDKRRIAFYPGGGYTAYVLSVLKEAFSEQELELFLFDSNPEVWGNRVAGLEVHNPIQLPELRPELVIVSNYNYGQEIFDQLKYLRDMGIPVQKLHKDKDVPWVF